ncbi:MAG: alpha/beta hydrolase [Verrucomicrobia bacterium]|nr:alpha/beta hydrolase [Verrucomicrobiota bacterium]
MPHITVNDIEIYYEIHGAGPPLLCIEGFTCNRLTWQEFIEPLSSSYQLILFDNRGSGQSSSPDTPYTIKMLAEDTAALLKELNLSKCFAIGHSMGGAILMQLCHTYPGLIRKGILANTFAKVPKRWNWHKDWIAKLIKVNVEKKLLIEGSLAWLYSEEFMNDPKKIQEAVKMIMDDPFPQPLSGLFGQMHALSEWDFRSHLHNIQTPMLIAAGDEDFAFPLFCAEELAEKIPHAELCVFQGQAHMILQERTEDVIKLMKDFFE